MATKERLVYIPTFCEFRRDPSYRPFVCRENVAALVIQLKRFGVMDIPDDKFHLTASYLCKPHAQNRLYNEGARAHIVWVEGGAPDPRPLTPAGRTIRGSRTPEEAGDAQSRT